MSGLVSVMGVAVGAAVAAPARYLLDRAVQSRHDSVFPFGTLLVNVIGSLLLGVLIALPADGPVMAVAGAGFCGALSTYSTFSYETLRLLQDRAWLLAVLNISLSLIAGLGAGYSGIVLAQVL
ncbi:MAG: fluoride efflux transporter FluC [Pseudonocardiaceae bacterium]